MRRKTRQSTQIMREESRSTSTREAAQDPHGAISVAAYYRSEARGFAPGHECEDWLEAEREFAGRDVGE